ncbi:hypothetical protein NX059_000485 [Plenodomus lindquistii]|nr:hypothetical protein NX059_000485 [Plenodomus lindquistii]
MYFLIFTTHHERPYPCKVAFVARDFESWGCRVSRYPNDSPYIAEIKYREGRRNRKEVQRIDLMEIWAREIIVRRRESTQSRYMAEVMDQGANGQRSEEEGRLQRASKIVQDFTCAVVAFDKPTPKSKLPLVDLRPLPEHPFTLISTYLRLLRKIQYTVNADLPQDSNLDFIVADKVVLEFRFHESLNLAYLAHAVMVATGKGRMGGVERSASTGITTVTLYVEVGDCVLGSRYEDVETSDPVPVYERVECPPEYVNP